MARAEVERRQGKHPTLTVVDGRRGASAESVKPGGQIVYLIDSVAHAANFALGLLRDIAPEDVGTFKKGFTTLVNGAEAPVETAPAGATVILLNKEAYSRRIEQGWSLQAPDGVFELTAKKLKRQRRDVSVEFTYIPIEGRKNRVPAIILGSKVFG